MEAISPTLESVPNSLKISRTRTGRKHPDNRQRHQLPRKACIFCDLSNALSDQIQKSGSPEDSHCHHQPDQCRKDPRHCFQSIFCAFHKLLIHFTLIYQAISHDIKDYQRNADLRKKDQDLHLGTFRPFYHFTQKNAKKEAASASFFPFTYTHIKTGHCVSRFSLDKGSTHLHLSHKSTASPE